jgi:hypothetical protein
MEWHGVQLKKGDPVCCINSSGNFDDDQFDNALVFDPNGQLNLTGRVLDFNVIGGGMALTNVNGKVQGVWTDEKHVLTMELKDGKAIKLTAKDTAGKQLFDGPVETDEQRKAMPEAVAKQLETLEKNQAAAGEFGVVGR